MMTHTNKLDRNEVWFDGVYTQYVEGLDVLPTLCYDDTRGRGRVVLRYVPQVVVMTTVGCLLGEARSAS